MTLPPLLLTRPQLQSERFAAQYCARLGDEARVVISPVLKIEAVGADPAPGDARGLVFTSEAGVRQFAARCAERNLPVWTVGSRTAEVARGFGFACVDSADGDVTALAGMLVKAAPCGPLLHPCGRFVAGNLAEALAKAGISLRSTVIYDQLHMPLNREAQTLLTKEGPVLVPVFSPRTARFLRPDLLAATADLQIAALSPAVAEALDLPQHHIRVAAKPNGDDMMNLLIKQGAA